MNEIDEAEKRLQQGEVKKRIRQAKKLDRQHRYILAFWLSGTAIILICQLALNLANVVPNDYRWLWIVCLLTWILPWFVMSIKNRSIYRNLVEEAIIIRNKRITIPLTIRIYPKIEKGEDQ